MIQIDKLLHFFAGYVIAVYASVIVSQWWIILLASTGIGLVKELVWDKWMKKGTPEWMDWMFTILGAITWLVTWKYLM